MTRIILSNKPLVEAIFELRWELQETGPRMKKDPHYKILIGSFYDKVKEEYPFHEQLPIADIPDEFVSYVVQHRFRKAENEWPLIQIGPGIITLNDTESYVWEDFERRIYNVLDSLFESYPDPKAFRVSGLLLRYIDSIKFDYEKDNIFEFLKEKMKINISVYRKLFENTGVNILPLGLDLKFSYSSTSPRGRMHMRFTRGKKGDEDALIWEDVVQVVGDESPRNRDDIIAWTKQAHNLADDWFFKIIEGALLERFK